MKSFQYSIQLLTINNNQSTYFSTNFCAVSFILQSVASILKIILQIIVVSVILFNFDHAQVKQFSLF